MKTRGQMNPATAILERCMEVHRTAMAICPQRLPSHIFLTAAIEERISRTPCDFHRVLVMTPTTTCESPKMARARARLYLASHPEHEVMVLTEEGTWVSRGLA